MEYFCSIIIYYTLKLILPNLQSVYPSMQYPCLCTVFYLLTVGFLVSQSDFYFFPPRTVSDCGLTARISKVSDCFLLAGFDLVHEEVLFPLLEEPTLFQFMTASTE